MPRPGEGLGADPFSAQQARNAAMLAEVGMSDPAAGLPVAPTASIPGAPPGMTVAEVPADLNLPDYLTNPSAYVPNPHEPQAHLTPSGESELSAAEIEEMAIALAQGKPWEKGGDDTPDKAEMGKKKKCPSCGKENKADALKCTSCDKALVGKKARDKSNLSLAESQAVIYNTQGLNLGVSTEDGLVWKVACKTGTLALSPGPGQTDVEKPLVLEGALFDDMVLSFQEQAFPYVTVPETHANGSLENTGYVREAEVLSRDELLADQRLPEKHRPIVEADDPDTRYLLAGIEFTEPDVKQKALNGSIPDTSIGVKFNFRNKRSGKLYRAAWEHLALTPMPWVDGLVPFGLSQQGKPFDGQAEDLPYVGCYMPSGFNLSTRIQINGSFDESAARAAIDSLKVGDSWSWEYDVTVQRVGFGGEDDPDGHYLLQGGYLQEIGSDERAPLVFSSVDRLIEAVSERIAACEIKRQQDRARYEGGAKAVGYSMGLSILFDPKEHPRDYLGKFRTILDGLKKGESADLPGGTTVTNGKNGFEVHDSKGKEIAHGVQLERAAEEALHADPDSPNPHEVDDYLKNPDSLTPEGQAAARKQLGKDFKPGDIVSVSGAGLARYKGPAGKHKPNQHLVERMVAAPGGKSRQATTAHTEHEIEKYNGPTKGAGSLNGLKPLDPEFKPGDPVEWPGGGFSDRVKSVNDDGTVTLQSDDVVHTKDLKPASEEDAGLTEADSDRFWDLVTDPDTDETSAAYKEAGNKLIENGDADSWQELEAERDRVKLDIERADDSLILDEPDAEERASAADIIDSYLDPEPDFEGEIELPGDWSVHVEAGGQMMHLQDPEGKVVGGHGDEDKNIVRDDIAELYVDAKKEREAEHAAEVTRAAARNAMESQLKGGDDSFANLGGDWQVHQDAEGNLTLIDPTRHAVAHSTEKDEIAQEFARRTNLAQDGNNGERVDLSQLSPDDELQLELSLQTSGEMNQMPAKTVEELLASQQAELEESRRRTEALESQLSLAQGTISAQGEQLHTEAVTKRIKGLQDTGVSPAVCRAAEAVMLADMPSARTNGDEGLALSITTPSADPEAAPTETKLTTPTEIVEFMLSAMASDPGDIAARLAAAQSGLGEIHLSAHEDANSEAAKKKAVEDNERARHPERFDDDGKRK